MGDRATDTELAVLIVVLLAASFTAAWRAQGTRLRPDGPEDRQPLGSLFVPWAAFDSGSKGAPSRRKTALAFSYAHPDLVRRRGVVFSRRAIDVPTPIGPSSVRSSTTTCATRSTARRSGPRSS